MKAKMEIIIATSLLLICFQYNPTFADTVVVYGDVTLSGGYQAGHFSDIWDLTAGDITISFTYDGNGLVDDAGAHAWAELGVRSLCYGDFNPTYGSEGAGVWLATDYEWSPGTFDPDPVGASTLDLDDKLILQKGGGMGEGAYDLPSTPLVPGNNHRFWWDRDGVDPWQNDETANTGGIYQIIITLHATSDTTGTAYMTINGLAQGFETDGNWNTIELTPAGMTFSGDMKHLEVFYGIYGYGATHSVKFQNIIVTGVSYVTDPGGPITSFTIADPNPLQVGQLFSISAIVDDTQTGNLNIKSAQCTIYDSDLNLISPVSLSPTDGAFDEPIEEVLGGGLAPTETGVYYLCVEGTDVACNTGPAECIFLVVSEPGFITGGGWIDSPGGAFTPDPDAAGKATFGFVAKYKKGASVPDGTTEFQFKAGDLNFHSTSYDWLVVAGAKAQFKGVGTINGEGAFKFMLTAIDGQVNGGGGVDKFRIRIWDDTGIVYDNQLNAPDTDDPTTVLGGGSIVIHKK